SREHEQRLPQRPPPQPQDHSLRAAGLIAASSAPKPVLPPPDQRYFTPMTSAPAPQNRLARETRPYLLQHKDNPVHWWAWGPEALTEAKTTNRPILLSVGYAACHW